MQVSRRILLVDDEPLLLAGLKRDLRREFEVETAVGGREGLEKLAVQPPFAVVVSDFNMPGMNGVEFLRTVTERHPETVTAMLTGNAERDVAVHALHEGRIFRFLSKPCPRDLLRQTLNDALEQHRLIASEKILKAELTAANQELQRFNQELEQRVQERTASIQRLHEFVAELNGLDSGGEIGRLLVQTTAKLLDSRLVLLFLPDRSGGSLREAARFATEQEPSPALTDLLEAVAEQVFESGENLLLAEIEEAMAMNLPGNLVSAETLPITATLLLEPEGRVGVVCVARPGEGCSYGMEQLAGLRALAEATGTALANQQRRDERNRARDAIIMALAKLAEHRDPETGAHLERVQEYCCMLARRMGAAGKHADVITPVFIENIRRSSPLHDIGKVGVPDRILLKPGRLTADEFEIMKRHTLIGGDTIRSLVEVGKVGSFLRMGMEIAYNHHEKFDGSGYPHGRAGESIPLAARILALADVYDALTSRRVYKPAMSHDEAAGIIVQGRGTHFDPHVVDAFVDLEDRFRELAEHLADVSEPAPEPEELLALT